MIYIPSSKLLFGKSSQIMQHPHHQKKGMGVDSTRPVDHLVHHDGLQRAARRRDFSAHHRVEVITAQKPETATKDDEDVGVRQPTLLPLHRHQIALDIPEDTLLDELVHQPPQPQLEDAGHDVGAVTGILARQQRLLDLWPLRVAGEGDEKVRLPQLPDNGHTILVQLLQVPRPARKIRPEDDALTQALIASIHEMGPLVGDDD